FDFAVDEVKIPSWLEPLARNATVPAPSEAETTLDFDSLPVLASPAPELAGKTAEQGEELAAQPGFSAEGPTPNFGSSLPFDSRPHSDEGSGAGFAIGWKLALLVAGLLLAAAVGWYWYTKQPAHVSASTERPPALEPASPQPEPAARETARAADP